MTELEYATLLKLANTWQALSEKFEKSKSETTEYADEFQNEGDLRKRDVYGALAAHDEIRSKVYAEVSKKLALELGALYPRKNCRRRTRA